MRYIFLFIFISISNSFFCSVKVDSGVAVVKFEKEVPDTLYNFPLLKSIKFKSCFFDSIGEDLSFFKELTELSFEDCIKLKDVKFHKGSMLTLLSFKQSSIKQVPPSVYNLKFLKYLDISKTRITKLNSKIYQLTSLECLKVNNTFIKELNKNIENLIKLKVLWIENTEITKIPVEILNLDNLTLIRASWIDIDNGDLIKNGLKAKNSDITFSY